MSSTVRPKRDPAQDKFYTPRWAVGALCGLLPAYLEPGRPLDVLEPAAGDGAVARVLLDLLPVRRLDCVEVRAEEIPGLEALDAGLVMAADFVRDFDAVLAAGPAGGWDLVATNPPYSLALPFAFHALRALKPDGVAAILLRTAFAGSAARRDFMHLHPPHQWILPARPSFDPEPGPCPAPRPGARGDGHRWQRAPAAKGERVRCESPGCGAVRPGNDSDVYAWFLWHGSRSPDPSKFPFAAGLAGVL